MFIIRERQENLKNKTFRELEYSFESRNDYDVFIQQKILSKKPTFEGGKHVLFDKKTKTRYIYQLAN